MRLYMLVANGYARTETRVVCVCGVAHVVDNSLEAVRNQVLDQYVYTPLSHIQLMHMNMHGHVFNDFSKMCMLM